MAPLSDKQPSHLRPYDKSLEYKNTMYDKQAYKKDPDLCSTEKVRLVSGNIYKSYAIDYQSDTPFSINTQDEQTQKKLRKLQHELDAQKESEESNTEEETAASSETE